MHAVQWMSVNFYMTELVWWEGITKEKESSFFFPFFTESWLQSLSLYERCPCYAPFLFDCAFYWWPRTARRNEQTTEKISWEDKKWMCPVALSAWFYFPLECFQKGKRRGRLTCKFDRTVFTSIQDFLHLVSSCFIIGFLQNKKKHSLLLLLHITLFWIKAYNIYELFI